MAKYVYLFGGAKNEGNADMKNFEYIEYRYGKGVGVRFEGDDTVTYNLEDTEMRKIIL